MRWHDRSLISGVHHGRVEVQAVGGFERGQQLVAREGANALAQGTGRTFCGRFGQRDELSAVAYGLDLWGACAGVPLSSTVLSPLRLDSSPSGL